jgi:DNA invertase Pin-like site-specific DNA recombinase
MESHYAPDGARRAVRGTAAASVRRPRYARPRFQALTLLSLFVADGVLTRVAGGPVWLTVLYIALGATFALGRLAWERRRTPAAVRPAAAAVDGGAGQADVAPTTAAARRLAVGYVQLHGDGDRSALLAHRKAITAYADTHGLKLTTVVHDLERPAGESDGRPALRWALERIAGGDAQVLVVARLAHLSDTVANLPPLLRWFEADRRALVAVDLRLDTSTEVGRLAAAALDGVGDWERQRLVTQPRPAAPPPARRTAQGRAAVADRPELQQRIVEMREQGMTLQAIADLLNEEGVPTVRGGAMWRPSSVQRAAGYQRPRSASRGIEAPRRRTNPPN